MDREGTLKECFGCLNVTKIKKQYAEMSHRVRCIWMLVTENLLTNAKRFCENCARCRQITLSMKKDA